MASPRPEAGTLDDAVSGLLTMLRGKHKLGPGSYAWSELVTALQADLGAPVDPSSLLSSLVGCLKTTDGSRLLLALSSADLIARGEPRGVLGAHCASPCGNRDVPAVLHEHVVLAPVRTACNPVIVCIRPFVMHGWPPRHAVHFVMHCWRPGQAVHSVFARIH